MNLSWKEFFVHKNKAIYFQSLALGIYIVLGIFFMLWQRKYALLPYILVYSISLDLLIGWLRTRKIQAIWSGWITASAMFMLIDSTKLWIYLFGVTVALIGKALIRFDGRHVFNPANLGVIAIITIFPNFASPILSQWNGDFGFIAFLFCLSVSVSYMANRLPLVLAYWGGFILLATLGSWTIGWQGPFLIGTLFGAPALIFANHNITDPRTSPDEWRLQILMGLLIAGFDLLFRHFTILFPQFYALAIVTAAAPLLNYSRPKQEALELVEPIR